MTTAALLLVLSTAPSATILADVVNIRAEPNPTSTVVTRLRMGTQVAVTAREKGWARVTVAAPPFEPKSGWVGDAHVTEAAYSLVDLEDRARAALKSDDVAEAITWWSRAVALDPSNVQNQEAPETY